tara:strand:- start:152 stop:394 length:243 start_codon:yes stop_codon:yes gene_type:complete
MDPSKSLAQNMGVDLSRAQIGVAKKLLNRANVTPAFQKFSGKGVAKGMAACSLANPRSFDCIPDSPLHRRHVPVMATNIA